jgi:hypothetical protein
VLLADTLYYLSPLDDATLERMALRVADLLAPGGVCVLVNHYFFAVDPDRASRDASIWPSRSLPASSWKVSSISRSSWRAC